MRKNCKLNKPIPTPSDAQLSHTVQNALSLFKTQTDFPAGHPLPRCRPFELFLVRLDAGMKTAFILITHWDFELYGIHEPRNEAGRRETGTAGVKPCFVDGHCLFVCHTNFKASVVPIPSRFLLKIKSAIEPLTGAVGGAGLKRKWRDIGLHRHPMGQIGGFLNDVLAARPTGHLEAEQAIGFGHTGQ